MDISNKTLVWLVVATIAVSAFGTLLTVQNLGQRGLAGYATSNVTGNASVTIASSTVLRFAVSSLNFGSGSVNTSGGATNCTLMSNGTTAVSKVTAGNCVGFTTTGNPGLILENAGNTFMNVTVNFSAGASTFPGGTGGAFLYIFGSNETGSCRGPTNATSIWANVPTTPTLICTNLSWVDTTDSLSLGLRISIPNDADGTKNVLITAMGTSCGTTCG